jgi:competence protein ComEA
VSLLDRVRLAAPEETRPWRAVLLLTSLAIAVLAVVLLRPDPPAAPVAETTAPVAGGSAAWTSGAEGSPPVDPAGVGAGAATGVDGAATIVVEVIGGVRRPGVVQLPGGSRVIDAVAAAGGLTGRAGVNLARVLADGEQIVIGATAPSGGSSGVSGAAEPGLLDLNAADAADLEELPGIGPVLAERILRWRTDNGGFRAIAQLQEVPGIGPAIYADLAPRVRVG